MSQLCIRGGKCVLGHAIVETDLLINDGRIAAIGENLSSQSAQVIDARGLWVLPGGVDVHVHMPWPTGSHISTDDIASGTRAAAFGGVTTVIDFVIPADDQTLEDALAAKMQEARQSAWIDYSFHLNIRGDVSAKIKEIPALVQQGFPSFKVFMAYEGFRLDDADLIRVLDAVNRADGLVSAHAENGALADFHTQQLVEAGRCAPAEYVHARPAVCEEEAIQRLLAYQEQFGTRVHVHHVSTAGGVRQIARARQKGLRVSGETCPHYLVFTEEDYLQSPARAAGLICAPSIKSRRDQDALWTGLAGGALSAIATDHCPYSRAQKEAHLDNFTLIPGGMGGVETRLGLVINEVFSRGRLSLTRFAQVWAEEPARLFGLFPRKGIIAVGSDADLVLVDPARKWTLRADSLHMNTDCLPYEGMDVTGKPVMTLLRGQVVVSEDRLEINHPAGEWIPRQFSPKQSRMEN